MTKPVSLFGAADAAASYESNLVSQVFLPFAERLGDVAGPTPDEDVLDLACGTGAVTRILAARCGASRLTGVDITEAMLAEARRLVPGVRFVHGDLAELPVDDASADLVICQQGLQFSGNRPAAVAEMRRVLRPGGRVVVSCWADVARNPVFGGFRNGLVEMGWDDLVAAFAVPFSLPGDELRTLFADFDALEVREVELELPVAQPRELARLYACVPPFSTRFLAATAHEQERYLDVATDGIGSTAPYVTSIVTALRPGD